MATATTAVRTAVPVPVKPQHVLTLYVDDDEKKRLEKKRRKQRQSQGYGPKRKNLGKKPKLVPLDELDSWELYLRAMLITVYRHVDGEWEEEEDEETQPQQDQEPAEKRITKEDALNTILCCCPPDRGLQKDRLLNQKVTRGLEEDFGPIFDVIKRNFNGDKIEAALVGKTTALLQKLRGYFPAKMSDLAKTPYHGHGFNVCGVALEKFLEEMKKVAKFGHMGATVDDKEEEKEQDA